jgi:hypothetical protein
MLLVGIVALGVVAWAGTTLFETMWLARRGPDLTEVAGQGLALVARGVAGIAVALLIGSLVGRTMPALLIGVVVLGGWGLFVVPRAQQVLADQRAVWQNEDAWREGGSYLLYLDEGAFDQTRTGRPGEPGARVDPEAVYADIYRRLDEACGEAPDADDPDYDYDSPEWLTWSECAAPFWEEEQQSTDHRWNLVVPRSAWGDFTTLDIAMSALLGGAAFMLTVVVVRRRRPE